MDFKAPTMFGDEVPSHPQPRTLQQQQQQPCYEILEVCAKTLAARLGEAMEDVSFREFVDLVLAFSGKASEASMSLLVEQDIANRKSSVLRKVYFSSLHKIEDPPPVRENPSSTPTTLSSSMTFPEDKNHETLSKPTSPPRSSQIPNKVCSSDRPLPIESHSRASTATASSWSNTSGLISESYQFVSEFDDDEESLNCYYYDGERDVGRAAAATATYWDGLSTYDSTDGDADGGKSMKVFLEIEQEKVRHKSSIRKIATANNVEQHRVELPRNFEVITLVDIPGSDPSNRGRTYSVTTTTSASSSRSRIARMRRISNRLSSRIQAAVAAATTTETASGETATEATTQQTEVTNEPEESIERPVGVNDRRRGRTTGTIGNAVSSTMTSTFRRVRLLHCSNNTSSF